MDVSTKVESILEKAGGDAAVTVEFMDDKAKRALGPFEERLDKIEEENPSAYVVPNSQDSLRVTDDLSFLIHPQVLAANRPGRIWSRYSSKTT